MLEKFTNCVYVLGHQTAYLINQIQTYKVGSSKILPGRMLSYKTYYPIDKIVLGYFYIDGYDCYQLDDDIKMDFSHQRIKLSGGIEFYSEITLEILEQYFISRGIKYTLYQDQDYLQIDPIEENNIVAKGFEEQAANYSRGYKFLLQNSFINKPKINPNNIVLKSWQKELVESFNNFMESEETAGIIIAPTGCGKSFMIRYLSIFEYIAKTGNDVLIMTKRKEIFDDEFINETIKTINSYNLAIKVINLIDSDTARAGLQAHRARLTNNNEIFDNQTEFTNIYIINNDKFIASPRYSNYSNYSWGKIKLLILDESHWSGANKFNEFLKYMKSNMVDKIIGLSATPVRTASENKAKTLDIFKSLARSKLSTFQGKFVVWQRLFFMGPAIPKQAFAISFLSWIKSIMMSEKLL